MAETVTKLRQKSFMLGDHEWVWLSEIKNDYHPVCLVSSGTQHCFPVGIHFARDLIQVAIE